MSIEEWMNQHSALPRLQKILAFPWGHPDVATFILQSSIASYTFYRECRELDISTNEQQAFELADSFMKSGHEFIGWDRTEEDDGKLRLLQQHQDGVLQSKKLALEWTRIVAVFDCKRSFVYHSLAQALNPGQKNDDAPFWDIQYDVGRYLQKRDDRGPCGKIALGLLNQLRDYIEMAKLPVYLNAQMRLRDSARDLTYNTFKEHAKNPILVFCMDTPTFFSEAMLVALHSYVQSAFTEEIYSFKTLVYKVYAFTVPSSIVKDNL